MATQPVRVQLDDSPIFEAMADLDDRWNSFLKPRFTLEQVRKVAEYTQHMTRQHGSGWDSVHVIDMDLPVYSEDEDTSHTRKRAAIVMMVGWEWGAPGKPSEWTAVVDPDKDGLYDIGGGGWAWSHVPEPDRIPVEELKPLAGRHVHFVGEFDDPWDIATGVVTLPDWRERFTNFSSKDKSPAENSYFSFGDGIEMEWDEMAEAISDLPVCLVMADEMEMGICPTSKVEGWQWSLIEAFTRLGMLPPTNELYLPDRMDVPRSPELVQYLLDAFRAGVAHEVKAKQDLAANTAEYLAKIEAKVLASK
jgi:hypothetical protein